ncbi:MAG: ArsR family transcriptional regulator [Archaeoglobus sp.]|nr:ArsR family transcriptional regulator [Archaeoglobus sp.]
MRVIAQNNIDTMIIETLKKHPFGLSISQIASVASLNRMTVSRHLEILRARGFVDYRPIGPAKLWYLSGNYLEASYIIQEVEKPHILKMLKDEESLPIREKLGDLISMHLFRLERMALILMSGADSIMPTA